MKFWPVGFTSHRIAKFGRFWLMVIVMVGVMVKASVKVRVSVSVRSIVRVS